jgi:hypothetical protein
MLATIMANGLLTGKDGKAANRRIEDFHPFLRRRHKQQTTKKPPPGQTGAMLIAAFCPQPLNPEP